MGMDHLRSFMVMQNGSFKNSQDIIGISQLSLEFSIVSHVVQI